MSTNGREEHTIMIELGTDWWTEIDSAIIGCLRRERSMTPAEIGRRLGMSEAAATSILARMATEGRLRIRLVDVVASAERVLHTAA